MGGDRSGRAGVQLPCAAAARRRGREVSGGGEGRRLRPRRRAGLPHLTDAGRGLSGGVQSGRGHGAAGGGHHHAHPYSGAYAPGAGEEPHRPAHHPGGVLSGQGAGVQPGGGALRRRADRPHQGGYRYVPAGLSGVRRTLRHRYGGYLRRLRSAGSAGGGYLHPLRRGGRAGCGQRRLYPRPIRPVPPGGGRGGAAAGTALRHPSLCQLRRCGVLSGDISGHGAPRHPAVRLRRSGGGGWDCVR